jgi:hypothetical protein
MIPISAITPSKEIIETEKLWIQCPHATPTKLTGINKKSKIGCEKLLKAKAMVI